jgi:hypothetical protein
MNSTEQPTSSAKVSTIWETAITMLLFLLSNERAQVLGIGRVAGMPIARVHGLCNAGGLRMTCTGAVQVLLSRGSTRPGVTQFTGARYNS